MPTRARIDAAAVLAEAVPAACAEAAALAYEDAGIRGLCHEGRWEYALAAIRDLDLRALIERSPLTEASGTRRCRPHPAA